jgi:hypothetical protein
VTPEQEKLVRIGLLYAAVAVAGTTLFWLQYSTDYVTETDPLYHIGVTQLLKERGIARTFEWAQLSIWKDRYSDKEFLMHLLMIPFISDDPDSAIRGGKLFVTLLGVAIFGVFAWMLRSHRVPLDAAWLLILLVASAHWLVRLTILRGHVLSILLALLSMHFLLKGRWKPLAAVGFAYAWGYSAPHIIVILAAVVTVCRKLHEGAWEWKPLAGAAGGFLAGMILNPYFPNNLVIFWVQNVNVPLAAWGGQEIGLGVEMASKESRMLLMFSPLAFGFFILANLASVAVGKKIGWEAFATLAAAWLFFLLYLLSWKFIEYFAPLTVLAAALVFRDVAPEGKLGIKIATALIVIVAGFSFTYLMAREGIKGAVDPRWEKGAGAWIKAHVPKGETILHLTFDQFPPLFLRDREHRYLVALDPMFAFAAHPEETQYLHRISSGKEKAVPAEMVRRLGGRYLVLRPQHVRVAKDLEAAGAKRVYQDYDACVICLVCDD